MSESQFSSRDFANLLQDEEVSISVDATPWGKEVTLDDNRVDDGLKVTEEHFQQAVEFLNKYKDLVLEIEEIREKYDGIDEGWQIGKIAEEKVGEGEMTNGDFALIAQFGYSNDGTYTGQMRNIYSMFPNQEYSEEHFSKSSLGELTHTVTPKLVQTANKNAIEHDIEVNSIQVRAIRDVHNTESVEESVQSALERTRFKNLSTGRLLNLLYNAHVLLGDNVAKEDIENLII